MRYLALLAVYVLLLLAGLAVLSSCASVGKPGADERPSGHEQMRVELSAVVADVDRERRLLMLKSDDGTAVVLPIPHELRDFEKLRVGDAVVVSFVESIAWRVKPAGNAGPGVSARETLTNPMPGEAPGGAIERTVTVTATITAFDTARGTVTLTDPQGIPHTVKAPNVADLERVHVGDLVDITYSEVSALSIRPVHRPVAW